MKNKIIRFTLFASLIHGFVLARAQSPVVISEIMYHPVEEPAFNANGSPVLDRAARWVARTVLATAPKSKAASPQN